MPDGMNPGITSASPRAPSPGDTSTRENRHVGGHRDAQHCRRQRDLAWAESRQNGRAVVPHDRGQRLIAQRPGGQRTRTPPLVNDAELPLMTNQQGRRGRRDAQRLRRDCDGRLRLHTFDLRGKCQLPGLIPSPSKRLAVTGGCHAFSADAPGRTRSRSAQVVDRRELLRTASWNGRRTRLNLQRRRRRERGSKQLQAGVVVTPARDQDRPVDEQCRGRSVTHHPQGAGPDVTPVQRDVNLRCPMVRVPRPPRRPDPAIGKAHCRYLLAADRQVSRPREEPGAGVIRHRGCQARTPVGRHAPVSSRVPSGSPSQDCDQDRGPGGTACRAKLRGRRTVALRGGPGLDPANPPVMNTVPPPRSTAGLPPRPTDMLPVTANVPVPGS